MSDNPPRGTKCGFGVEGDSPWKAWAARAKALREHGRVTKVLGVQRVREGWEMGPERQQVSRGASLWDEPEGSGSVVCQRVTSLPIRAAQSFIRSFTEQGRGSLWGLVEGLWEGALSGEGTQAGWALPGPSFCHPHR